jgi:O-antigen ligase
MRNRALPILVVLVSATFAVTIALLLAWTPGTVAMSGITVLLCWLCFCEWPWAVLPAGIVGGALGGGLVGHGDIRSTVLMHVLPLVAGVAALLTRRLLGYDADVTPPRYGLGMAVLLAITVVGAAYGLAMGNAPTQVLVAAYEIAVIPVYYFLAAFTLTSRRSLRNAAIAYVVPVSALTAIEFAAPGRHGGLLSLLAVPGLVVLAGRVTGWARTGLALLAVGLIADVILASYRGVWLAAGIALVILAVRGGVVVLRGLAATAAIGAVGLVAAVMFGLTTELRDRSSAVGEALQRTSGYRIPEAAVGLDVFVSRPIFGAGLGQTTPRVYIPGFALTDVGPVYHAFYVLILANLGIVGLCVVAWPILRAVWTGLSGPAGMSLAFAALSCGFLAAAFVASPADGHWELGLLPALTLLTRPVPAGSSR